MGRVTIEIRSDELGPYPSEGARQLWGACKRLGGQNALEREIKAPSGMVNRWLHCKVRPGMRWASAMEKILGIRVSAWLRPPRRPIRLHP